jgi:hypothetical protein
MPPGDAPRSPLHPGARNRAGSPLIKRTVADSPRRSVWFFFDSSAHGSSPAFSSPPSSSPRPGASPAPTVWSQFALGRRIHE